MGAKPDKAKWGFWSRYTQTYGPVFSKDHLFYEPDSNGAYTACGRWPELMYGHKITFLNPGSQKTPVKFA